MRSLVLRFSRSYLSGLFFSRCHSCCRLARFHSRDSTESNKQGLSQHSDHLCPRILWTQTATKPKLGDASFIACFTQIHSILYVKTWSLSLSHRPDPPPSFAILFLEFVSSPSLSYEGIILWYFSSRVCESTFFKACRPVEPVCKAHRYALVPTVHSKIK